MEIFSTAICFERHDPERDMARFDVMIIAPKLFGEWALVREWGRIGNSGTLKSDWFRTEEEARAAGDALVQRRILVVQGKVEPGSLLTTGSGLRRP